MRGFSKSILPPFGAIATVCRDLLNHAHVVQISSLRDFVTLFQCLRIACAQYFCDKIATSSSNTHSRQSRGWRRASDRRCPIRFSARACPAYRSKPCRWIIRCAAGFCHRRFVADIGHAPLEQGIHQTADLPTLGTPIIIMRSGLVASLRCGASWRQVGRICPTAPGFWCSSQWRGYFSVRSASSHCCVTLLSAKSALFRIFRQGAGETGAFLHHRIARSHRTTGVHDLNHQMVISMVSAALLRAEFMCPGNH